MHSNHLIAVIIGLAISTGYLWYQNSRVPVDYFVCNTNYEECFLSARYKTMADCEVAKEKGNWLCDHVTDPNNIPCKPAVTSFARSYCRD